MEAFHPKDFLPVSLTGQLTEIRIADPERARRAASSRRRRARLTTDGRLNILAADHPARRVTKVGEDSLAMTDRQDYLARIVRVLGGGSVDGVMATMDILEDLLVLNDLAAETKNPPFLDEKLLIVSLNRGGLAGAIWEMDDPMTGPAPADCKAWGFDGAKILLRICDQEHGSLKTMVAAAQAIAELNSLALPTFVEPLPVVKSEGGYQVTKTADALRKIIGVVTALGNSSRYLWLKLPHCKNYDTVARATTLPILLLGGESAGDATLFLEQVAEGLAAGPNVRGALVGRNVLYPGDADPLSVAEAVGGVIHKGWTVDQAVARMRGRA
jgi:DhnA family fructose-bisphosphate aldolase class Ia